MKLSWDSIEDESYIYSVSFRTAPTSASTQQLAGVLKNSIFAEEQWPKEYAVVRSTQVLDNLADWKVWDVPIVRSEFAKPSVCCYLYTAALR